MATFSVDFLGCKVSHADAQAVRERLLADGHVEQASGDVAVVNTCCVTHEALRKSRHAASRAARTHRRVYVTGCGANLSADAFAGLPENVVVVARRSEETAAFVAGDVGAIGCVQADVAPRPRPRVREGAGRLQLLVRLLRDPARPRRVAQPQRRCRSRRDAPPRRAGPSRGRAHRHQPRLLPRPRGRVRPAAADPRGGRDAGARAAAAVLDRGQPPDAGARSTRCARRRPCRGTCTFRSSPATTACCGRWRGVTTPPRTCAGSSPPPRTST